MSELSQPATAVDRFAENIKLNLGCGYRKMAGYINIDNRKEVHPDLLLDVTTGFPFYSNTIDEVVANDFLEHVPQAFVVPLIEEIYRVLKPGGKFNSSTPSTDGRGAFQDPHHVSYWNLNSWFYYSDDECRKLYGIKAKFSGQVTDWMTDKEHNIIHTRAELVKE